jgi:hypothetical protein
LFTPTLIHTAFKVSVSTSPSLYGDENKDIVVIVVVYICIVQLSHGVVIEHRRICVHIPSQDMAFMVLFCVQ